MGTPLQTCGLLCLLAAALALSLDVPARTRLDLQPISLLEMSMGTTAMQGQTSAFPPGFNDTETLLYISDQDERVQVAVDFNDAETYARERIPRVDEDERRTVPSSAYMTGDLYNNDRTDESKLIVSRVSSTPAQSISWTDVSESGVDTRYEYIENIKGYELRDLETFTDMDDLFQFDSGDVTMDPNTTAEIIVESENRTELTLVELQGTVNRVVGDRLEVIDEDEIAVLFSKDGYDTMMGDLTNARLSDEAELVVRTIPGPTLSPERTVTRTYDLDDLKVMGTPDLIQAFPKTEERRIISRLRTREIGYPVDEEKVQTEGIRYSEKDKNLVPILVSLDADNKMVGDLYANKRTDETPLRVVSEERQEAINWFAPMTTIRVRQPLPTPPPPPQYVPQEPNATIVELQDVDDIKLSYGIVSPRDFQVFDLDDLPEYASLDSFAFMVGDLYANLRTDNSKLDVRRALHTPVEIEPDADEAVPAFEEPESVDFDDVDNIFLNRTWADVNVEETVRGPREDQDEGGLQYAAPEGFMTGDLYDNARTDSSMLIVRVERTDSPLNWTAPDTDDAKTVYQINLTAVSLASEDQDEGASNETVEFLVRKSDLETGDRFILRDGNGVPVLYSEDSRTYLAGDLFNNRRSDVAKLTTVLRSATLSSVIPWSSLEDSDDSDDSNVSSQSRNPGFLE